MGGGASARVLCSVLHDAGPGVQLYAGGDFSTMDSQLVNHLAIWNGQSWIPTGGGLCTGLNAPVIALGSWAQPSEGPSLFVSGLFTDAGCTPMNGFIARWYGGQWFDVGGGFDHPPHAFLEHDDGSGPKFYIAGRFVSAGGFDYNAIVTWDGTSFSPVGQGQLATHSDIRALAVYDDGTGPALYAGGLMTLTGPQTQHSVLKWNGQNWISLGATAFQNVEMVQTMTVFDDGSGPALYVAGGFFTFGPQNFNARVAKLTGSGWSPVGIGIGTFAIPENLIITSLTAFDNGTGPALYAGGNFSFGPSGIGLASWNGGTWDPVLGGTSAFVRTLRTFDDGNGVGESLFVGGEFSSVFYGEINAVRTARLTRPDCPADLNCDGQLDFFDVTLYLSLYAASSLKADFTNDSQLDFFDIMAFLQALSTPCF